MIEKIKNSKGLLIFTVISFWICVLGLVGGINDAMTGGKRYSEEEMQLKVNTAVQEQKDKDEKTRKSLEDKIDELNALIKVNEQKLKDKENELKEQAQENKEQQEWIENRKKAAETPKTEQKQEENTEQEQKEQKEQEKQEQELKEIEDENSTVDDSPDLTFAQLNCLEKAGQYLHSMFFSRSGLADQLAFEGYEPDDIEVVMKWLDNDVDYNEQAKYKAQEYLETMPFSLQDLIGQLEYEGFTPEQAQHGANEAYK